MVDLRKWLELMDSYEAGGFMYHATMPTDALAQFRDVMLEVTPTPTPTPTLTLTPALPPTPTLTLP